MPSLISVGLKPVKPSLNRTLATPHDFRQPVGNYARLYRRGVIVSSRWGSSTVATRGSAVAQARPPAQTASSGIAKAMVAMHRLAIASIAGSSRGPVSARGVPVAQTQTPATSSGEEGEQGLLDRIGGFFKGAWDAGTQTVKGLALRQGVSGYVRDGHYLLPPGR